MRVTGCTGGNVYRPIIDFQGVVYHPVDREIWCEGDLVRLQGWPTHVRCEPFTIAA